MLRWYRRCIWCDSAGITVVMPGRCIRKLVKLAQTHAPQECGSWLIGKYPDKKTCVILDVAEVPRDSVHGRMTFSRGVMGFERVGKDFVGEWHTHPGGTHTPSGVDDETMNQIRKRRLSGCASPIMMILSGAMRGVDNIGVYMYRRDGKKVELERQKGVKCQRCLQR